MIIPSVLSHTHYAPITSRPSKRKTDSNYICEHTWAWVWTNTHIRTKTFLQVFASVHIEWQCWHWLQTLCVIPTACISNFGSTVAGASESSKSAYKSKAVMWLNHYASYTGLCTCSADCLVALNVFHISKPWLNHTGRSLFTITGFAANKHKWDTWPTSAPQIRLLQCPLLCYCTKQTNYGHSLCTI